MRAEPVLKGDIKTLQTTDWSEMLLITRIVLNLCKINMLTMTALWSPDERASRPTHKQITLVSVVVVLNAVVYVTLRCFFTLCCSSLFHKALLWGSPTLGLVKPGRPTRARLSWTRLVVQAPLVFLSSQTISSFFTLKWNFWMVHWWMWWRSSNSISCAWE